MAEVYIDALHNYLNGPEWHQSIQIFVDSNCKYFSNVSELDHQQHALWKTFQEIVETVLEMALETIGGSFQQLEDAIDALQSQPSRGPRDEKTKDLLTQLMSFTDFETFAAMMNQAFVENNDTCQDERRSNDKHVDALLRLGFPLEAIDATIEAAAPHSSLEDLVIAISGYQSELPKKGARISFAHCNAGDAKYHYDEHDSAPSSPRPVEPEDTFTAPLAKFASEAAEDGEKIDLNELNAKFVIADSVLDSFDLSVRVELAPGSAMQALLRWAEDMRMLRHDVCIAYEEQLPSVAMCFNCKDGLVEWYRQLERARQEIDQASAAGSMLSDAELHRMAELDKIAVMGTADEQLLHSLISRHDQVCKEVEALQRQASLLMAAYSSRGVRRETLEELYVFLKQQVANGADLEAVGDEMHERVYSAVSSSRGAEVVNLLLDMHIHEDEQALLESRIHSIVGSLDREQATEPAAVKLSDLELDEVAAASAKGVDDGTRAHSATAPTQASSMFAADSKGSVGGGLVPSSAAALVNDPHVQSLKDQHRAALVQLKQLLTADKERRLKALEEKLLRRRALLQKSRQQQQGAESAALEAEQLRAVQEVEAEIVQAQDSCELRTESMVSGFKKRCTSELTVARAKGAGSDIAHGDKKNSAVAWELTEEERSEAHRLAAQALKERFEREQKALLASLDEERHKQHDRILKQLAAKRKKAQQAGRAAEELAVEEREALVAMNVEFDQMQATALGKAQERAFLSLAAMHVSTSQLDSKQGQQEAAEEGSYLDEADQGSAGGRQWLETVDRVRECYTGAAAELQLRLRASAVSSAGKREDGNSLSAFTETAGMMSRVVADAFEKQCQEECGDHAAASKLLGSASSKHGGARADTARVRAGIMEEFERARRELEESFAHSQQLGRNRTDLRRQSRSQHKEAAGDQREASVEESEEGDAELMRSQQLLLEGVVDSYLGGEPVPDIATVYAQSERAQAARSSSGDTYSAARRESQEWEEGDRLRERARIKSVHVEKEQSLVRAVANNCICMSVSNMNVLATLLRYSCCSWRRTCWTRRELWRTGEGGECGCTLYCL